MYVVTPLVGLIVGVSGIRQGPERGLHGLAIAGVVICSLALVVSLIVIVIVLVD